MKDDCGRELNYLRISVTDLCNLRCNYCMPEGVPKCSHDDILTYEEIARIVSIMAGEGIKNIRLTGGEPLVRPALSKLVRMLRNIQGIRHIALTTNGVLLKEQLPELIDAGLSSVNISLDSLCKDTFIRITGRDDLEQVMDGIKASVDSGISTKINVVPQLGYNDSELIMLAGLAKEMPVQVRFIEMMPIGGQTVSEGLTTDEVLASLSAQWPDIRKTEDRLGQGPARYYRIPGWTGAIGFISAVHGKFCAECNRLRLTSTGFLRLCLASEAGADLKGPMRNGMPDEELRELIIDTVKKKPLEHRFLTPFEEKTQEMFRIGG